MTDLRTAATQALEALEGGGDSWRLVGPAIDALRAALEQPEQEPVAWWNPQYGTDSYAFSDEKSDEWRVPLFTPPPRREWRGLTEEEMINIQDRCGVTILRDEFIAIEAKLKELNA